LEGLLLNIDQLCILWHWYACHIKLSICNRLPIQMESIANQQLLERAFHPHAQLPSLVSNKPQMTPTDLKWTKVHIHFSSLCTCVKENQGNLRYCVRNSDAFFSNLFLTEWRLREISSPGFVLTMVLQQFARTDKSGLLVTPILKIRTRNITLLKGFPTCLELH